MNTTEEQIVLTDEQIKMNEYKLYKKNYNKLRYIEHKEKIKENQKLYYINRVSTDPDFRNKLVERTKNRYYKNKEPKETKPEQPIKKMGRPRKY